MATDGKYLVQVCSPGPPTFLMGVLSHPFNPCSDAVRLTFNPHRALCFDSIQATEAAQSHPALLAIKFADAINFVGNEYCVDRETWTKAAQTNSVVQQMFQMGSEKTGSSMPRGIGLPGRQMTVAIATNSSVAFRWDDAWAVGIWRHPAVPGELPTISQGVYEEGCCEYNWYADKPEFGDWGYLICSRGRLFVAADLASGSLVPRNWSGETND